MVKALGFTYLFCNDLQFYSDILGLELIWDSEDSIAYLILSAASMERLLEFPNSGPYE